MYELKMSPTFFYISLDPRRPLVSMVILCESIVLGVTFYRVGLDRFLMAHLWGNGSLIEVLMVFTAYL
jgi:hypothetical protein